MRRLPSVQFTSIFALLALLLAARGRAQQYSFQEATETDGLTNLSIYALLQDQKGLFWVGTENGLFRFDGKSYVKVNANPGPGNTYIAALSQSANGELWVGTPTGTYHGDGAHFDAIIEASGPLVTDNGLTLASLSPEKMVAVSNGNLFLLQGIPFHNGWHVSPYFNNTIISEHPELKSIRSIFATSGGTLWMGCGAAICQVTQSVVHVWRSRDGVANDKWTWFLCDATGRLWARGIRHVVALTPGATSFATHDIPGSGEQEFTPLVPIVEDFHHRIVAANGATIAIWESDHWTTVGPDNGLKVPGILSMLVDRDHGLFLGTLGVGVEHWLGYGNWESWNSGTSETTNPLVWTFLLDHQKSLWIGTENGISVFNRNGRGFSTWHFAGHRPLHLRASLAAHDGSLWFAGNTLKSNVLRYDPDTQAVQAWTTEDMAVRSIQQDSVGRIWLLSSDGLRRWSPSTRQFEGLAGPDVPAQDLNDMCEDPEHTLWFTSAKGLFRFSNERWSQVKLDNPTSLIFVGCSSDGSLWLGADTVTERNRLQHVWVRGGRAIPANTPIPEELSASDMMFLRFDHRHWLWIGTSAGLFVFNGERWLHLTKSDGLTWNDCDENAFLEDQDGSIWIGTAKGISHLVHPEELFAENTLQIVAMDAKLGDIDILESNENEFAWTRDSLSVHLAASDFDNAKATVFHYRLIGAGNKWLDTSNSDLQYPSLPSSHYKFEVFATNRDKDTTSSIKSFSFQIRPPWWKSRPFEVVMVLTALLSILLVVRTRELRREKILVARHKELEAVVRERTSELEREKLQLVEAREAMRQLARHDPLTGILNRGAICESLEREFERSTRTKRAMTVAMVDVDHFKIINDQYGHLAGDQVLREFSRRLAHQIRAYDFVGRYGGEEFLLVMPDCDLGRDLDRIQAMHRAICAPPIQISGNELTVTCSIGACSFAGNESTAEQLLSQADAALYRAKNMGRNRVEIDTILNE